MHGSSKRRWSFLAVLFVLITFSFCLSGCGGGGGGGGSSNNTGNTIKPPDPGPEKETGATVASSDVGAAGGMVVVTNTSSKLQNTHIDIPANALTDTKNVTISELKTCPKFAFSDTTKTCAEFGPDGTVFNAPVTITLPLAPASVAGTDSVDAYYYDKKAHAWVKIAPSNVVGVDRTGKTISINTDHFTGYATTVSQPFALPNFEAELFQNEKSGLVASVVFHRTFGELRVADWVRTYKPDVYSLEIYLQRYLSDLLPVAAAYTYKVTLMEKAPFNLSTNNQPIEISTKSVSFETVGYVEGNAWKYDLTVRDGKTISETRKGLSISDLQDWFSARPILFTFDCNNGPCVPKANSKYYVILTLYISSDLPPEASDCITQLVNNGTYCSEQWRLQDLVPALTYGNYDNRTDTFFPSKFWSDANQNSIVDSYEAQPDKELPTKPTNLTVTSVTSNQIGLSWSASSDNDKVLGYKIYKDNSFLTSVSGTSFTDTGLSASRQYCYTVAAFDPAQNPSPLSDAVCATTIAAGGTYSVSGKVTLNGAGLSGVLMTLYVPGHGGYTYVTTDANGNFVFAGLNNDAYTLQASMGGCSFWPRNPDLPDVNGFRFLWIADGDVPGQDFTASGTCTSTYTISGKVTLNGAGMPGVAVALTGTGTSNATTDSNGNYIFTGAANGSYTITASLAGYSFTPSSVPLTVNNGNVTVQEIAASVTVAIPSVPSGVSAVAADGQVTVSWGTVSGATSYNVYWATTSGVTKSNGTKISNVTSPYAHTGRTNGTTYYYVVTAVNSAGESNESTQASAKPTSGGGDAVIIW